MPYCCWKFQDLSVRWHHKFLPSQCFLAMESYIWPFQLEWLSWAGLMAATFWCARYTRRLVELHQAGVQAEYGESGSCFGHVCNWKTRREDNKRITVEIFTLLKDAHVMLPRIVTSSDQCLSQKITVFCLHFSILLFGSLTCPLSCFLYYFIAVSESRPLPPPLSLFIPSLSSFSIPSSLPLPIFACATFNCSDMPCGKLCLCVLEQALLVMAVVPDVRGGV